MKTRLYLLALIFPISVQGQISVKPFITGEIHTDKPKIVDDSYVTGGGSVKGHLDNIDSDGYAIGAGVNFALKALPFLGLQVGLSYDKSNRDYISSTKNQAGFNSVYPTPYSVEHLRISPAITFTKFKRLGVSYYAELGLNYFKNLGSNEPNYIATNAALGAGFSGAILKVGYSHGLNSFLPATGFDARSRRVYVGLNIYPTVLLLK